MKKKLLVAMLTAVMAFGTISLSGCESATDNTGTLAESADEAFAKEMTETLAYDENLNDPDTLFRGAGSDSEHATADYIVSQFEAIGLQDVTKDEVTVDGWQTGESYMKIGDIDVQDLVPYQATGTHAPDGTAFPVSIRDLDQWGDGDTEKEIDADWSKMEIVDVGTGTAAEYEGVDVEGKIVLVAVNQWTEYWIDSPYTEAFYHGAAAVISYQYDEDGAGYGMYDLIGNEENCDIINVQDICEKDLIPCGAISPKDAAAIKAKMKADNTNTLSDVNLKLTCEVKKDTKAYNVLGKIPGQENTGQRILIGGHYDKYHGGVNDDCTAVALSTAIGKAIIDSGYQPRNDIYIVAHCSEEWGRSGAADDWAIGSWEEITEVHPDWQGSTLAFINFEMPAIKSGQKKGQIQTSYEFNTMIQKLLDSDALNGSYYEEGVEIVNDHNVGMSDCISYQENGVPAIINKPDFDKPKKGDVSTSKSWFMDRYHTKYDDMSTYSSELMTYDIVLYGTIAEYIDSHPALELDLTSRCDALEAMIDGVEAHLPEGSTDLVKEYKDNLAKMREAGAAQLKKAQNLNNQYDEAVANGGDTDTFTKLSEQGVKLNKVTLKGFAQMEDELMGIIGSDTNMAYHVTASATMDGYASVIKDLEAGKVTTDGEDCTLARIAGLGGFSEFTAMGFSKYSYDSLQASINCDEVTDTWGFEKAVKVRDTYDATANVMAQMEADNPDYSSSISIYQAAYDEMQADLVAALEKEIAGMQAVTETYK